MCLTYLSTKIMTQNSNDDVFQNKKKPKGPIKFKLELNEEQKEAKQTILDNPVVLIKGMAGSGKTLVACQVALDLVFKKEMNKIIITRATVSKEDIGFLPGDLKEKMDPWLAPIYANLYLLYDKEKIDKMVVDNQIEVVPFAFMRGRTFPNAFVIVDECQNITGQQTEMMLGRLGKGGKIVFCGDLAQVDLKSKKDSGIGFFPRLEERIKGVRIITLKKNHRHEIVEDILKVYEEFRD
jgi:phosphate starvation-inducible PhoH-like protein